MVLLHFVWVLLLSSFFLNVLSLDSSSSYPLSFWRHTSAHHNRHYMLMTDSPENDRETEREAERKRSMSHRVILALHEKNVTRLKQLVVERHTPSHPLWLHHLTVDELHDLSSPPQTEVDDLIEYLTSQGVDRGAIETPKASNALFFTTSLEVVERVFRCKMKEFRHIRTGHRAFAAVDETYLPSRFHPLIDFADGVHYLPFIQNRVGRSDQVRTQRSAAAVGHSAQNKSLLTRNLLQNSFYALFPANSLYAFYNGPDQASFTKSSSANAETSVEVVQFWTGDANNPNAVTENSFSPSDLSIYSQLWSESQSTTTLDIDSIIGPNNAANPQGEPTLDVQAVTSMYPQASADFENQPEENDQMYAFASRFVARTNVPQVVSISYGLAEAVYLDGSSTDTQDGLPYSQYLQTTNTQFMKIALRGVTILASSGDDGANSESNTDCDYGSSNPQKLLVEFPASSPYVTAVGGTEIQYENDPQYFASNLKSSQFCNGFSTSNFVKYGITNGNGVSGAYECFNGQYPQRSSIIEEAVSLDISGFTSGGGTSRVFSMPAFQSSQASAYFSSNSVLNTFPPPSYYDTSKRTVPDVAMFGLSLFPVIVGKSFSQIGGTSLSSPLFAGVVNQLNNVVYTQKGSTLGWLNPLLYHMQASESATFVDITVGNNNCPRNPNWDTTSQCIAQAQCQGYPASIGYDLVTGLGVPNINAMVAYVNGLVQTNGATFYNNTGSVTNITGGSTSDASLKHLVGTPLLIMLCVTSVLMLML